MVKQSIKENSLDLEYNNLLGMLGKIKDMTSELHRDVYNLSLRIKMLSKRNEISEDFKKAAEKANMKLLEKLEKALMVIGSK
ncbi:hypothetical protein HYV89_03510 [Candidatus Woesearchaeota archaeon]|nr:hypothetical protein [Candidatus Woesearchaeota archaeon]